MAFKAKYIGGCGGVKGKMAVIHGVSFGGGGYGEG